MTWYISDMYFVKINRSLSRSLIRIRVFEKSCFLNVPLGQLVPGNHDTNEPKKFVKKRQVCDLVFFNEFKTTYQSTKLCLKISQIEQKQKIKQFQSNTF